MKILAGYRLNRVVSTMLLAFGLAASSFPFSALSFSLIGPYDDWMTETNFYRYPGEVGGPMDLHEEYRWNVPLLTYGFDESLLSFFGSNGVAAVEAAFQVLNDLPRASEMSPDDYPAGTRRLNYLAQSQFIFDLKSTTLSLLLEQLGLGPATQNIFVLRHWDPVLLEYLWPSWVIPNLVYERNFDPHTLAPSHFVNGFLYSCGADFKPDVGGWLFTFISDPSPPIDPAPASEFHLMHQPGAFLVGLTADDVGGLRYLLGTNNINFETLLPAVRGAGTNAGDYIAGALRPGVEKITFVRHPCDPGTGRFSALTNGITDTFLTNGVARQQQLERIITQPDFLFCAGDNFREGTTVMHFRSNTWFNVAALSQATNRGPGIIHPPVQITFHRMGGWFSSSDTTPESQPWPYPAVWGSFSFGTNGILTYPPGHLSGGSESLVHLRLSFGASMAAQPKSFTWRVPVQYGETFKLQSSTNLLHWLTLGTITNQGGVLTWSHEGGRGSRFFRVVP